MTRETEHLQDIPSTSTEPESKTKFGRAFAVIKNHPLISVLVSLALFVIFLGKITAGIETMLRFRETRLNETPKPPSTPPGVQQSLVRLSDSLGGFLLATADFSAFYVLTAYDRALLKPNVQSAISSPPCDLSEKEHLEDFYILFQIECADQRLPAIPLRVGPRPLHNEAVNFSPLAGELSESRGTVGVRDHDKVWIDLENKSVLAGIVHRDGQFLGVSIRQGMPGRHYFALPEILDHERH